MKTFSAAYTSHLASDETTLTVLVKFVRTDAATFGFTGLDTDVSFGSLTYLSEAGITPTAVNSTANLAVDNLEIQGGFDANGITKADVIAGLWDGATITVYRVNYNDPDNQSETVRTGRMGKITLFDNRYKMEIRSLSQHYQQAVGRIYTIPCDVDLGSTKCGVALGDWTEQCVVTAFTDRAFFEAEIIEQHGVSHQSSWETNLGAWFTGGLLTWDSAIPTAQFSSPPSSAQNNDGLPMEVQTYDWVSGTTAQFTLVQAMPYDIEVGDLFQVYAGCDKSFPVCRDTFSNWRNHRGFPHVPGEDRIRQTPGVQN